MTSIHFLMIHEVIIDLCIKLRADNNGRAGNGKAGKQNGAMLTIQTE